MALKPCLKCGHEISEVAEVCPKCKTKTGELDASFMNVALDASRLSITTEEVSEDISLHLAKKSPPETRRSSQQSNSRNEPRQVVNYHPSIIEKFANELYSQAENLVITTMLTQGVFFGGVGVFISFLPFIDSDARLIVIIGLGVLGLIWGYITSQPKALALKFQAQMARCVLQIEFNTRDRS